MESSQISYFSQYLIWIALILAPLVYWVQRRQSYFRNLNIPCVESYPLVGSFFEAVLGRIGIYDCVLDFYNRPEVKDKPFFGIFLFHKPALMVTDPEIIKKILVKDFNKFTNRYSASDVHDPLGNYNLFSVKNPLWKTLRGKLSPFFSSGKLKAMYYLLSRVSNELNQHIHKKLNKNGTVELELKELASLYATDVIASCAYGVDAHSLENPNGEFRRAGAAIFEYKKWRKLEFPAFFMLPQVMKFFKFKLFSEFTSNFIMSSVTYIMGEREKSGSHRNDLIDTLIDLKHSDIKDNQGDEISMEMLIAQAAVFFSAGFETSSATQSFALYEISKNKDFQDKVRSEIKEMLERNHGKVNYDAIMSTSEMPFLHQIVCETLRLYPILPLHDRECSDPNGYSLEPQSHFKIPYKMPVWIPVYAIHRDEKYFPDPLKFDPERFSPENIKKIIPGTYMPFGIGPRSCIGERFGLMQVKTGIVKILKDFRMEPTLNTPRKINIVKQAVVIQSDKGLIVRFVKDMV